MQEQQTQAEQTETTTQSEFDRLISSQPMGSRQRAIVEGGASFLGMDPKKVISALKGIWTTSKGQEPLTDYEVCRGLALVSRYELDPFAREIYVTRDKQGRLMIIIGLDGWIRILDRTDHYDGFEQELVFDPTDDDKVTRVITRIFSKKRSHPTTYVAIASEYAKLGGFMASKIPSHMLRIFSLRHAARLFVPLGCAVTEEEARWMTSTTTEPAASSLDELADKMTSPAEKPAADPPLGKCPECGKALYGSDDFDADGKQRLYCKACHGQFVAKTDPPLDPPTENEVANDTFADQSLAAEGFSIRIANAVRIEDIDHVEMDFSHAVATGKLSQKQSKELAELVKGARARIGK